MSRPSLRKRTPPACLAFLVLVLACGGEPGTGPGPTPGPGPGPEPGAERAPAIVPCPAETCDPGQCGAGRHAFQLRAGVDRLQQATPKSGMTFRAPTGRRPRRSSLGRGCRRTGPSRAVPCTCTGRRSRTHSMTPTTPASWRIRPASTRNSRGADASRVRHLARGGWCWHAVLRLCRTASISGWAPSARLSRPASPGSPSAARRSTSRSENLTIERYATEDQRAARELWEGGGLDDRLQRGGAEPWHRGHDHRDGELRWNEISNGDRRPIWRSALTPLIEGNVSTTTIRRASGRGRSAWRAAARRRRPRPHRTGQDLDPQRRAGARTDIDNLDGLYQGNLVDSNGRRGIFHEISVVTV